MDNNRPTLYVPDYEDYAVPFESMFNVVTSETIYDDEVVKAVDVLMLTGGGDIDPSYYNEKRHPATYSSTHRDSHEYRLIQTALERGVAILGICRGAEWLSIVAGGKLFQHVSSHQNSHAVRWGKLKTPIHTSSLHHQMCDLREVPDAKVLAWADGISNFYEGAVPNLSVLQPKSLKEPEVFTIDRIKGFAVQGHPEMLGINSTFNSLMRCALADFLKIDPPKYDAENVEMLIKADKLPSGV